MGIFKDRSDFFKNIATSNKQISHDRDLGNGEVRKAFHRLNDDEELQAACVNYAHFPCLVHFGFDGRYGQSSKLTIRRKLHNAILVLDKVDDITNMDEVESVKDSTFELMEEILSWMKNECDTKDGCGPFTTFDLTRCSFSLYNVNANLWGWLLSFEDEIWADEVNNFDASKWY